MKYSNRVRWEVLIGDEFEQEFQALHVEVQNEILALAIVLRQFGPQLGRPRVDTLKDSRHANMKELRFEAQGGVWRLACCVRFRPEAPRDPADRRRQIRWQRKTILPRIDSQGRRSV
jgi:hypothetical protein